MYTAVRNLDDECDRMPEARAWSGPAHDAANHMFGRATRKASQVSSYAEAVATALQSGSGSIGAARHRLLTHADSVDRGELSVTDQWVVLIKPARVSAEKAASLRAQAEAEQKEINRLLTAVGDADEQTASAIQRAAGKFGFSPPDPTDWRTSAPLSAAAKPADEVPNPMTMNGLIQQGVVRDHDMAMTVRDSKEWTTSDGQTRKTLLMMDGSRHEIWEWGSDDPTVADQYLDQNGKLISNTLSQNQYDGTQLTSIEFGDGTKVTMTRDADGRCTGEVTAADGRKGLLPDEFFSHPALTTVGGAMTGLEEQAKRGIPRLTTESLENLGKAAKYGGPTLGIATALYDTVTAKTFHDGCVAAISGGVGVAGGAASGSLAAAGVTALGNPELAPVFAMGGDMLGGWTFGYIGGIIGNVVCPQ